VDRLVEPGGSGTVDMLRALPPAEALFYATGSSVVGLSGTSDVLRAEIEARFCFVGGPRAEYIRYFCRTDLPEGMWLMRPFAEARAVAGFSAILKKTGTRSASCSLRWRPTRSGPIRGAAAAWACTVAAYSVELWRQQGGGLFPRSTRRTRSFAYERRCGGGRGSPPRPSRRARYGTYSRPTSRLPCFGPLPFVPSTSGWQWEEPIP